MCYFNFFFIFMKMSLFFGIIVNLIEAELNLLLFNFFSDEQNSIKVKSNSILFTQIQGEHKFLGGI